MQRRNFPGLPGIQRWVFPFLESYLAVSELSDVLRTGGSEFARTVPQSRLRQLVRRWNLVVLLAAGLPWAVAISVATYSLLLGLIVGVIMYPLTSKYYRLATEFRRAVQFARSPHLSVPEFLDSAAGQGQYAVFLRGSARESTYIREEEGRFFPARYGDLVTGRALEHLILRLCGRSMMVVGLANLSVTAPPRGMIRLSVATGHTWQEDVISLVERAVLVVLFLNNWTPGLLWELSFVRTHASDKVVVLVSEEVKDSDQRRSQASTAPDFADLATSAPFLLVRGYSISWWFLLTLYAILVVGWAVGQRLHLLFLGLGALVIGANTSRNLARRALFSRRLRRQIRIIRQATIKQS